jgi:hypothetical protein
LASWRQRQFLSSEAKTSVIFRNLSNNETLENQSKQNEWEILHYKRNGRPNPFSNPKIILIWIKLTKKKKKKKNSPKEATFDFVHSFAEISAVLYITA